MKHATDLPISDGNRLVCPLIQRWRLFMFQQSDDISGDYRCVYRIFCNLLLFIPFYHVASCKNARIFENLQCRRNSNMACF
jgi:hypothetical protein